jgi:hypothetical protein
LQNIRRDIDQRRTALGDEHWRELPARAIGYIKCGAVRVENARSAFDNKPVEFLRSNGLSECFAKTVQEIEDERLLDLDLLMRPL